MKQFLFFSALGFFLASCGNNNQTSSFTLQNASSFYRNAEIVEIPWEDFVKNFPETDTASFHLTDASGKELIHQIEYADGEAPVHLLVQADVPASGETVISVRDGKPSSPKKLAYGRYVPERLDDFAWENDRIAFRMYGEALESTPKDNAFGVDVWSKRTSDLVIDEWYKTGDYHEDHGDGLDYYKVGYTLGGGDMAPYVNDSVWFPKNYRNWKVLDNGPLRIRFELGYEPWEVDGRTVSAKKRITLDAGSNLNRAEITYETSDGQPLTVLAGIVLRPEPGAEQSVDTSRGMVAYHEPAYGENGSMYLAILAGKASAFGEKKGHLASVMQAEHLQPVSYWFGAAWSKSGQFNDMKEWVEYLKRHKERSAQSITVKF